MSILQFDLIAHRGLFTNKPELENSEIAFRELASAKIKRLEIDLRYHHSRGWVIFHDLCTNRLLKKNELTYNSRHKILSLGDFASIMRQESWSAILEIKSDFYSYTDYQLSQLGVFSDLFDKVTFSSFHGTYLIRLKRLLGPRVSTAALMLPETPESLFPWYQSLGVDYFHPHKSQFSKKDAVSEFLSKEPHKVSVYTIKSRQEMLDLNAHWGITSFICDDLESLIQAK